MMDSSSDSNETRSDQSRDSTTSDEVDTSNSEDTDSFIDELDQISLDEWEWEWDVDNSKFSSIFNYFDERALGINVIRPIDAFGKYISHNIIELIVDQTNIYGRNRCAQKGKNATDWKELDAAQICAFLGILLIMGFHKLPRIRDYWSTDRNLFTPAVANAMTRNEFQRIFSNIHLADNTKMSSKNLSNRNKLYKLHDFLALLKRNFQKNYSLGSCASIDEAMIKFKGRSTLKQYQPLKSTKRGYKVWVLAESSTRYVYNFEIYTGKSTERPGSLGEHVIMSLIDGINLKNRQFLFDSFFTSLVLLYKLRRKRVGATGTIRSDRRNFPIELKKNKQLDRGDYQYFASNGISVVRWMDKKEVFVASNYFDPEISEEVTRGNKDGSRVRISCPLPIVQYNKYMGGVDLSDQKTKYYTIDRKSKRNWMRIFFRFLGISLINSLICYKNLSHESINTVEYISSISTALIGDYVGRKRAGRPLALNNQKKMRIEKNISEARKL